MNYLNSYQFDIPQELYREFLIDLPENMSNALKTAYKEFEWEMVGLYCPDLFLLPITPAGESIREILYKDFWIGQYGSFECRMEYENDIYLVIIVNND